MIAVVIAWQCGFARRYFWDPGCWVVHQRRHSVFFRLIDIHLAGLHAVDVTPQQQVNANRRNPQEPGLIPGHQSADDGLPKRNDRLRGRESAAHFRRSPGVSGPGISTLTEALAPR